MVSEIFRYRQTNIQIEILLLYYEDISLFNKKSTSISNIIYLCLQVAGLVPGVSVLCLCHGVCPPGADPPPPRHMTSRHFQQTIGQAMVRICILASGYSTTNGTFRNGGGIQQSTKSFIVIKTVL